MHFLTGNDFQSQFGTKLSALKANPLQYLQNFAETDNIGDHDFALAEEYLVKVWNGVRGNTSSRTFDQLRLERDTQKSITPLEKFPPTSSAVREHLRRGFFLVRKALMLLTSNESGLSPVHYGWYIDNDKLLPSKGMKKFNDELLVVCDCKGKCTRRCKCFRAGQKCVIFCHNGATSESKCVNH